MMWLLLSALSFAADLDLDLEGGVAPLQDASFNRFGSSDALFLYGGRAGLALTDALTVQLAAHHGRKGATWYVESETIAGASALYATDASLGLEAVVPVNEFFAVGGVATGGALLARTRVDSDPENRNSTVELAETALTPTFRTAAVTRFTVPESSLPVPLHFRLSLGYQWSGQASWGELGDAAMRGWSFRFGAGVQL